MSSSDPPALPRVTPETMHTAALAHLAQIEQQIHEICERSMSKLHYYKSHFPEHAPLLQLCSRYKDLYEEFHYLLLRAKYNM